ncbi:hypothetical protein ABK040_015419 [Willaertia magna]
MNQTVILSILLFAILSVASASYLNSPVHDRDLVQLINDHPRATWQATIYPQFANKTIKDIRGLLGTMLIQSETDRVPKVERKLRGFKAADSFDSRTKWPHCIHPIRDQEQCGSCWAFSASEVLSDRYCIASNGEVDIVLSPQYMLECDSSDYGCSGGYLNNAWKFLEKTGIPSDECDPYTSGNGKVGKCPNSCKNGDKLKLYKALKPQHIRGVENIQQELSTNGPLQVAFQVYRDFMSYKSGVYKHVSGGLLGGHAVKLVGWGVDTKTGLDYWILANSWGNGWGLSGFFWMLRGRNECNIEGDVWAGIADI